MAEQLIGTLVPTKIPGYSDTADIQAALKVYHYGSYTFNTAETDPNNLINPSIAYSINNLQNQITNLPTSIKAVDYNSKGVLLTASAPSTVHKLSVGVDGQILSANSLITGGLQWINPEVTAGNTLTFTNKTLLSPLISLSTTSSTVDSRISWDTNNKKILVGNGTNTLDFTSSSISTYQPTLTSNNYTVILSDKDKMLDLVNSVSSTLTIPAESSVNYPIGTQIHTLQASTGQFTIVAASGVIINATPGLKLRTQWSSATLIKRGMNMWVAIGDLSA
jgi:hypothetical protein